MVSSAKIGEHISPACYSVCRIHVCNYPSPLLNGELEFARLSG